MIKYLIFILGSVVVENVAFFTTNTALELTAKNNPVLMRLLQTVDAATTDERLLDVSLQLLKSLCLCMRETLKTKQLESSLFSGDTNSLQAEDDTKDPSKKVLELYQNIYNKTCYDLKNEVASKVNKSANISSDEEKDFMLRSDCGKTPIHDGTHIHETQNQVTGTNKDDPRLEDILYQTFIKTRNYHRFRARKYSLYKATEKQIRVPAKHNIIVILTFYPSSDSRPSITNCTKLTDQLNNTLLTHSPIDIDIIDARFGQKENVSEESLMPKEATDCTLKSIYTFLLQSERNNKTKVFKLMRRSNSIKVYIDVTSGPNHSDYTKTCCSNRTDVSLCKIEFSNESFDSKEITTYPSTVDKSNNFKETISKIKSLVKLYDKKLKKKKLRRLTTQPSVKQNMVKNNSMTEDNTKIDNFTKKEEKGKMNISKNPLKSVSPSTFLINDAGSKELWMNSIADDESSHEKYKIHNTDISLPISLVHKATIPLEVLTEKENQVKNQAAIALHSKLFASSLILPNKASVKPLLSTEPLNVQNDQNFNVEQSLSETSSNGLQMTATSDLIHFKIEPTANYNTTASRIIYNDSRQLTPNKHKSKNINLSYGNKDIVTTIVDLPLENTLEIVVTANDKQKKLTFDELFAEPNLKEMNHNPKKTSEATINNEEKNLKTSKDPFSNSPFFSICISLSKKTQHTELSTDKSANNMKFSTDDTTAHENVNQITHSNTSFDVNNLTELPITPSISNTDAQQDKIIEVSTSVTEPWGTYRTVSIVPTEKSNLNNTLPSTSSKHNSIDNNINQLILKSSFAMHTETATLKSYDMISNNIFNTQDGNRFTNHSPSFESIEKANNDLNDTVKSTKLDNKDPYTIKKPTNCGHTSTVDAAYKDTIGKYTTIYSNRTETEHIFTIINQSTETFPYRLKETNESKKNKNSSEPKNETNHFIAMLNVSRIILDQQEIIIYPNAENEKKYSEALNSARTKGVSYPHVTDPKNSFEFVADLGDDKYKETEKLNSITGINAYTMTEYNQTPTSNLRISLNQSKTADEMKIINRNLDKKHPPTGYSETESYTTITFSQNNTKLDKSKIEEWPTFYESILNTLNVTNNYVTDTIDLNIGVIYKDMDAKDISITHEYIESRNEPDITKQVSIPTINSKAIDASDTSKRPEYQSSISNHFNDIEESNVTTTDDSQPEFEYSKLSGAGDYVTFPDFFENRIKKDENRKDKQNKLLKNKVDENYYEPANHINTSGISTEKTGVKNESDVDGDPSTLNTLSEIKKTFSNISSPNTTSEFHRALIELNDTKKLLLDDDSAKESSHILIINKNTSVARNQEKPLNKIKFSPSSGLTQNTSQDTTPNSLNHIEYTTDKTLVSSRSISEILELFNTTKELAGIAAPTEAYFTVTGVKRGSENEIELSTLPEWPLSKIKSTIMDVNYSNHDVSKDYLYTTKPHAQKQTKNITTTIQRILVNDDLSKPTRNNDMDQIMRDPQNISDAKTNALNGYLINEFSINPQVNEIFENIPYTTNNYSNSQGGGQNISHINDNFSISKSTQDRILMSTVADIVTDSKTGVKKRTEVFDGMFSYTSKSISHGEHENKSHNINSTLTSDIFIANTKVSHSPETAFDDVFNAQSNDRVESNEISESTTSYLLNQVGNTAVFKDDIFNTNKETKLTTIVDQSSYGTQIDNVKYPLTDAMDINSQVYEGFDNLSHTYTNSQSENNAITSMKTDFNIFKPVTMIAVPTVNNLKTDAQNHHESDNTLDTIKFMAINVLNTSFNNIDLSNEIPDSTKPYLYHQNKESSTVVLKHNINFTKKDTLTTIRDAKGSIKYPHSDTIDIHSQVYEIFDNTSHTSNQDPNNQNANTAVTSTNSIFKITKPSTHDMPMIVASTVNEPKTDAINYHESESTPESINYTLVNVLNSSFSNIYMSKEILDSTKPYVYNQNTETSTVVLKRNFDFTKKDTFTTIRDAKGSIDPEVHAVKYPHSDTIDKHSQVYEVFDNLSHTSNQDRNNQNANTAATSTNTIFKITKPSTHDIPMIVASIVNEPKPDAINYHESESIPDTINYTLVNVLNTSISNIDMSKEILDSTKQYVYNQNTETSTIVLKHNIDFTNKDTLTTIRDAKGSIAPVVHAIKYPHSDTIDMQSEVYEVFDNLLHTSNQDPNNQNAKTAVTSTNTIFKITKPSTHDIPMIVSSIVNEPKPDAINYHESESTPDTINYTLVNVLNSSFSNIYMSKEILDSTKPYVYNQNTETSTVALKLNIDFTKKDTLTTIRDVKGSIDHKVHAVKYPHSDTIDKHSQVYEVFDNLSHTSNQDPNNQNANTAVTSTNTIFKITKPSTHDIPMIVASTLNKPKTDIINYHESESTPDTINYTLVNVFERTLNNIDLLKEILNSTIPYLYNQNEEPSTVVLKDTIDFTKKDTLTTMSYAQGSINPEVDAVKYPHSDAIDINSQVYEIYVNTSPTTNQDPSNQNADNTDTSLKNKHYIVKPSIDEILMVEASTVSDSKFKALNHNKSESTINIPTFVNVFNTTFNNIDLSKKILDSTIPYLYNRNEEANTVVLEDAADFTKKDTITKISDAKGSVEPEVTVKYAHSAAFDINAQVNEIFDNISSTTNQDPSNQKADQTDTNIITNHSIIKPSMDKISIIVAPTINDSKTEALNHHESESILGTINSTFTNVFYTINNIDLSKEILDSTIPYLYNQNEETSTVLLKDNIDFTKIDSLSTISDAQGSVDHKVDVVKYPHSDTSDITSQVYEIFGSTSPTNNQDPSNESADSTDTFIRTIHNMLKPNMDEIATIVAPKVNNSKTERLNHHESESIHDTIKSTFVNVLNSSLNNINLSKEIPDSTVPYVYKPNEETSTVVLKDTIEFTKKDFLTTISDAQGSVDLKVGAVKYQHSDAGDKTSQVYKIFDNASHTTNQDPSNSTSENVLTASLNNIDLSKEILDSTIPYLYNQNIESSTVKLKDNINFTKKYTLSTTSDTHNTDPEYDVLINPHTEAFHINSLVKEIFDHPSHTTNLDTTNENAANTVTSTKTNYNYVLSGIEEIPIIVAPTDNDSKYEALSYHKSESTSDKINNMYDNVFKTSFYNIDLSKEIFDSTIPYLYNQNEETSTAIPKDNINISKNDTVTISDARGGIDHVGDDSKYTHSDAIEISSQAFEEHTINQDLDLESQRANKTVGSNFNILKTNNNMSLIFVAQTGHSPKTKIQNPVDIFGNSSSLVTKLNPHGSVANKTEDVNILLITDQINVYAKNQNKINFIQESTLDTTTSAFLGVNNINSKNHNLSKYKSENLKHYLYDKSVDILKYTISNSTPITSGPQSSYDSEVKKLNYSLTEATEVNSQVNEIFGNLSHTTYPNIHSEDTFKLNEKVLNIFNTNKVDNLMVTQPTVDDFKTETLNFNSYTTKSYPSSKQGNKTDDIRILLTSDRIYVSPESTIDTNNAFIGEFSTHHNNLDVGKNKSDNPIRISTATLKYITSNKDRTPINTTDAIDMHSQVYEISDKISHATNQSPSSQSENKVISYKESNNNTFFNKISGPREITENALTFGLETDFDTNFSNLYKSKETLHMRQPPYQNTFMYLFKPDNLNISTANNSWKPIENVTESVFDSYIDTLNNASYTINQYSNGQVENKSQDIVRLLKTTFDIPFSNSRIQTETDVIMSSAMVRNNLNINTNTITKSYLSDQSQGTNVDLFRNYNNNISKTDDKVSHVIRIAKSGNGPRLNAIKTSVYNVFNYTSYPYNVTKNISYPAKPSFKTSSNTVDYLKKSELNSVNTESSNTDETMVVHSDLPISSMIGKTKKIIDKENQFSVPLMKTLGTFTSIFPDGLESVSQSTVFLNDGHVNSFKPMNNPATVAESVNFSKVNSSSSGLTEVFDVQSEVRGLPGKIFFTTETFAQSKSYAKTDETYAAPLSDLSLPSMLSKIKKIFRNEHEFNVSLHNQNEITTTVPHGNNDLYVFESNTDRTPKMSVTQTVSDSMIENLKHLHANVFDSTASYITETYLPSQSENKTDEVLLTFAQLNVSKPNKFNMQRFGIIQSNIESEISNAITTTPESINNTIKPYSLFTNSTDPLTHYLLDQSEGIAVIEPTNNSYNVPSSNSDNTFTTNIEEPNNLSILDTQKYSHTENFYKNFPSKVLVTTNAYTSPYISTKNDISTFTTPPIYEVTIRSTDVSKTFNKSVDSDAVGLATELDLISKSSKENLVPMYTKERYNISSQPHEFTQNMSHVTKRYSSTIDQDIPHDIKVPVTNYISSAHAYHTSSISNKTSTSKSAVSNVTLQNVIGLTSTMMDEMQVATYKNSNDSLDLTSLIDHAQDIPSSNNSLITITIKPFRNLVASYTNKPNTWPTKIFTEKSDIKLYSYSINKNSPDANTVEVAANRTGSVNDSFIIRMLDKDQESMNNDSEADYNFAERNKFQSTHPENYSQSYLQNSNGYTTSIHHNYSDSDQYPSMTPITTSFPVTRNIKYGIELNHSTINNDITQKPLSGKYSSDIILDDINLYSTNAIKHYTDVVKIEGKVMISPSMIASIPPTYDHLIVSNMVDDTNDVIKYDDQLNSLETITKNIWTGDLSEHLSSHTGTPPFFPDQEKSLNLSREHKVSKTNIPREVLNTNNLLKDVQKITNSYKDTTEYVINDIPFTINYNIQETNKNNWSYISNENNGRIRDISAQNTPILDTPNIKSISNFVELMKTGGLGGEQKKMDDTKNRAIIPNEHFIDIKQTSDNITDAQQFFAGMTQRSIQDDLTLNAMAISTTDSVIPLLADVSYDQAFLATTSYYSDKNKNRTDDSEIQITNKRTTFKDDTFKMQTTDGIKVVSNMLKKVMVKNDINMNILPKKSNASYKYSVTSDNSFNLLRSTIPYSQNQQKDKINYLKDELNTSSGLKAPSEVSARSTQFKKQVTRFTIPNPHPSAENIYEDRMTNTVTVKNSLTTAFDLNQTKLFSSVNNTLDTTKSQTAKETKQFNPIKLGVDIKYKNGVDSSGNNNMLSHYFTEAHTNNGKHFKSGNKTGKKPYLVTVSSKEINNVYNNYENHAITNVPLNQNRIKEYSVEPGITKTNINLDNENEIELDDLINKKPLNITVFKNKTATDSVSNLQYMDQVNFLESVITTSPYKVYDILTQKIWNTSSTKDNMLDKTNRILNTITLKNKSKLLDPYTINKILPPPVTTGRNEMESKTMTLNLIKDQHYSRKTTYKTNNILLPLKVETLISKEQSVKKNTEQISIIRKPVDDDTGYKAPILALNMTEFTTPLQLKLPKTETHNTEKNIVTKMAHSRIGNKLTTSTESSSFRGFQQTSYSTKLQEDTTIHNINLTSPPRETDFLIPNMSPVTVVKMITEAPYLIGKKLLDKNAVRLSDTIDTLPLNETADFKAMNDFFIYNLDINSTTVKNTLNDINKIEHGSNVYIDLITAREPKITNRYMEQSEKKLNNKNSNNIPLITENIDQATRHSIIIPINIKFNIKNSNITRVHDRYQNLTTLVVPTTLQKRNKNMVHELINSASFIANDFGIKQKNRDKDDVYTKTIFIINRLTDHSTSDYPQKKVKAEVSFDTYFNKNDNNIKQDTGENASFSLFNGTDKAYTMFLNPGTRPFDNTHSRRTFISKAKYLESLADRSDKKNNKKVDLNTLINLNKTSKPNFKTTKSIIYNTYKALTEEELTLPPDVRKIITTYSTIYTKEMNNSNQIAKLKTSKTGTKQMKYDVQSKLSVGNNTKKIKKSKLINVMKENVSVDAFINDTLQLNRRTYLHPIEKLPIKIQRKSLKRIKLKNRKGSIMALNTNDFLSYRRAATIRNSVHEIVKAHPMPVLKHQMKASNIGKVPRRLILRPMFNSFEDFKKNPVVKPIIPKHIIMPDDNDFYRSSFQNPHKPIKSWKETIGGVRAQLQPQRRSGPIPPAQRKDYESVIDVPYYMPTLMKPYFLRDKVESVRSYIYNEEKSPVNTRTHFRSPPRVETSGAVVDATDSQEHVYYSAGASREDVTELSSPRVTRPKKTIFFLSPTIPYNRYF